VLLTSFEQVLLDVAESIFNIKVKCADVDFFEDLGGDSLSAAVFCTRLGNKVSIADLYAFRLISALAMRMDGRSASSRFAVDQLADRHKAVPQGSYTLFSLMQLLGGMVWMLQLVVFTGISLFVSMNYFGVFDSLFLNLFLQAIVLCALIEAFSVISLVFWLRVAWVGRHRPGKYVRFGFVHWKWWWLQQLWRCNSFYIHKWLNTPVGSLLFRACGLELGSYARLCTALIDCWDRVRIGEGSFVQSSVHLHNVRITDEGFYIGFIGIGEGSVVGAGSVVNADIAVGRHSVVRLRSLVCVSVPDE
jgi:hypothetical protein